MRPLFVFAATVIEGPTVVGGGVCGMPGALRARFVAKLLERPGQPAAH